MHIKPLAYLYFLPILLAGCGASNNNLPSAGSPSASKVNQPEITPETLSALGGFLRKAATQKFDETKKEISAIPRKVINSAVIAPDEITVSALDGERCEIYLTSDWFKEQVLCRAPLDTWLNNINFEIDSSGSFKKVPPSKLPSANTDLPVIDVSTNNQKPQKLDYNYVFLPRCDGHKLIIITNIATVRHKGIGIEDILIPKMQLALKKRALAGTSRPAHQPLIFK